MLSFEWDETKARSNFAKHGVSFEAAARAFEDPLLVELEPQLSVEGEIRFSIVADNSGMLLFVVYVERLNTIRIISARRATKHERQRYEEG